MLIIYIIITANINTKDVIGTNLKYLIAIAVVSLILTTFPATGQFLPLQPFPLNKVHLSKSPFLEAQQTDLKYMLKLDPDKLLAPYLREAGLNPKAVSYSNWENTGLDGHTAGHYLTALAQMYAATGNDQCKTRLDYMINELKRCQDNRTDGYVGGIPGGIAMWEQLRQGDFELFYKKWVPWYNLHKLYAGLRDAYLLTGNEQARQVLIKLTDWADLLLSNLTKQQIQLMLKTEQGGMNEVCADVAAITGDNKYLVLARKFSDQAILAPLEAHKDELNGLHANTQIPKVIGFERIAELGADKDYASAARFFWETVVKNRTISIGGNSVREHFNPLGDFLPMLESVQGPETCNSYNMLKLTKMLFLTNPDAHYMDYYERTLYNHILSSQHPDKGGFVYFTPVRPQHYRVYSAPDESFWCCVGTGMENHGKYGEMIYAHRGDDLYVNLFIASVLNWTEKGITVIQNNNFPFKERSEIKLQLNKPETFKLYIRQPAWLKGNHLMVFVNGKKITTGKIENGYVEIIRHWANNDKITVLLPMKDRLEYLPDHSSWVSVLHGPIVLAAATDSTNLIGLTADSSRFGHITSGALVPFGKSPILIGTGADLSKNLQPVNNRPLTYHLSGMIYQPSYKKLTLIPFFELHDARYVLYWPIAKPGKVIKLKEELTADDDGVIGLAQKTVDEVAPGEQQPESDHFIESSASSTGIFKNRHWREAAGFFSYKMKMTPTVKKLQVTYYGNDKNRDFDILLDDKKAIHVNLNDSKHRGFFTNEYQMPAHYSGNNIIIVKFKANIKSTTGKVFCIRLIQ